MNAKSRSKKIRARARRQAARPGLVQWRDAVEEHCQNLEMLAQLLKTCGRPLDATTVVSAGYWVDERVKAVRALLNRREAGR